MQRGGSGRGIDCALGSVYEACVQARERTSGRFMGWVLSMAHVQLWALSRVMKELGVAI